MFWKRGGVPAVWGRGGQRAGPVLDKGISRDPYLKSRDLMYTLIVFCTSWHLGHIILLHLILDTFVLYREWVNL